MQSYAQSKASSRVASINTYPSNAYFDHKLPFQLQSSYAPGEKMIKTGKILTLIGGVLTVGGGIIASTSSKENPWDGVMGVVLMSAGIPIGVTGAILWHKGSKKYKRSMGDKSLSFGIGNNGPALNFKF